MIERLKHSYKIFLENNIKFEKEGENIKIEMPFYDIEEKAIVKLYLICKDGKYHLTDKGAFLKMARRKYFFKEQNALIKNKLYSNNIWMDENVGNDKIVSKEFDNLEDFNRILHNMIVGCINII